MTSKVYLVMNDMGVVAVYGIKEKAEARATAIQEKYAMNHWIETKEITTDD